MSASWTLTGRWVLPVDRPPLENGVVTVRGDRIVALTPHGGRRADVDLGNVAVLPGLVNAHTHLDLSGMRGLAPPTPDFVGWLRRVIEHRRTTTPESTTAAVDAGLAECLRHGVTLVGDVSAGGTSHALLTAAPLRSVVFHELLGLTVARAAGSLTAAQRWLTDTPESETCRLGLSPHAPYSVRSGFFTRAAQLTRSPLRPLAVHLAESREELDLLHHQRGPFVAFLKDLGVWDPSGLTRDVAEVVRRCDARTPTLFVHGNYLAPSTRLPRNATIVYCPRTHTAFGHPPHSFRDCLRRGVRVALGTDGLASNPDLDVLAEARFVHERYPDLPGSVLLRMLTLSGAEALGLGRVTGSLTPGKSADLVALSLPEHDGEPHELVFGGRGTVRRVLFRGAWRKVGGQGSVRLSPLQVLACQ